MRKSGPTFPMITVFLLATLLLSLRAMGQSGEIPLTKKSGHINYIEIGISQPNVEGCYELAVSDTRLDKDWINIFPNPNPGQFTLEVKLQDYSETLHIHIYDITGKLVFSSLEPAEGKQFSKELNVSFLEKGVYFIRIKGEQAVGVKQIIIN